MREIGSYSMIKFVKFALFAVFVVVGYSMWKFNMTTTREIVSYGLVKTSSHHNNGELIARSREVRRGNLLFWEVELPDKTWIDCEKNCADALRKGFLDKEEEELDIPY